MNPQRRTFGRALSLAVVSLVALPLVAAAQQDCVGDCGSNGEVTVDELIKGVNIALGASPLGDCPAFDSNGNGKVTVDELVMAVNNALTGCPVAAPSFVGWDRCRPCHSEEFDSVSKTGHPRVLVFVDGKPPVLPPNAELVPNGNYPPNPPAGFEWSDVSYVIGGWGWKTRYLDQKGFIITCPPGDVDDDGDGFCDSLCAGSTPRSCDAAAPSAFEGQWNLYAKPGSDSEWVPYHMGEFQKKYDCGRCHTTGYDADVPTEGMPGIVGSWSEPGIRCEACHGPGGDHVNDPVNVDMQIDRSSEFCGNCHVRGGPEDIDASGGFIRHHEQWDELFNSPKNGLVECTDCHDPHKSSKFDVDAGVSDQDRNGTSLGIKQDCATCHPDEAATSKSALMKMMVACVDCHMPRASKSALAFGPFAGDVRTHLFQINEDAEAFQFTEDGKTAMPYLTLNFACRACHKTKAGDPQPNSVKNDAELHACSAGYHESGPVGGRCQ